MWHLLHANRYQSKQIIHHFIYVFCFPVVFFFNVLQQQQTTFALVSMHPNRHGRGRGDLQKSSLWLFFLCMTANYFP